MDTQIGVELVTSGACGLGLATTERTLDAGARAVILDLPSSDVEAVTEKFGAHVRFSSGDVTK